MKKEKRSELDRLLNEVVVVRPASFSPKSSNPEFLYPDEYVNHSMGKVLTALEAAGVIEEKGQSVRSDALRSQINECFWGDHCYTYSYAICKEELQAIQKTPIEFNADLIDQIKKF